MSSFLLQWICLLILFRLTGKKVWLLDTINDIGMLCMLKEITAGSLELRHCYCSSTKCAVSLDN